MRLLETFYQPLFSIHCYRRHDHIKHLGRQLKVGFYRVHCHDDVIPALCNANCYDCMNKWLCSDFYISTNRWDLPEVLTPLHFWQLVQRCHSFSPTHDPVGTQCLNLVTCQYIQMIVCHVCLVYSSKLVLRGGRFTNDLSFFLVSLSRKRLRFTCTLTFGLSNTAVNIPAADSAASLSLVFKSHVMACLLLLHNVENNFFQFQTGRKPSHTLLLNARQGVWCRSSDREQYKSKAHSGCLLYW